MGKRLRRSDSGRMVSASDLAQMGRCERLVVFEQLHGRRRNARQQRAWERGRIEHRLFYLEGRAASGYADEKEDGVLAGGVFGESRKTRQARRFRHVTLRPGIFGRWAVRRFCRVLPVICSVLCRWPALRFLARVVLKAIALAGRWWPGVQRGRKCRR